MPPPNADGDTKALPASASPIQVGKVMRFIVLVGIMVAMTALYRCDSSRIYSIKPRMNTNGHGCDGRAGSPLPATHENANDGAHGVTRPTSQWSCLNPCLSVFIRG